MQAVFCTVFPQSQALLGPKILTALSISHSAKGQFDIALLLTNSAKLHQKDAPSVAYSTSHFVNIS
jgi:hypothetical protein